MTIQGTGQGIGRGTGTAAFHDRAARDISSLRGQAETLQAQIGRGERLARSSDDPVAATRLRQLARAATLSAVDTANTSRLSSDLQLADVALSGIAESVIRVRELATQAASGTLTAAQRGAIGKQVAQIHGSLVSLANSRDTAGHALFGGEAGGDAYAIAATGAATGAAVYAGTASAGALALGDGQAVGRGLAGPEFLTFTSGGTAHDLLAVVKGLADALQGGSADPAGAARDALSTLDAGLDAVTTGQTVIGTRLAWLDMVAERRTALSELRAEEQAEIGGTDIASTVAQLQETMLVLEASQASFSRLAQISLFDVLR